jgi:uncharacterized DUF497 family protein
MDRGLTDTGKGRVLFPTSIRGAALKISYDPRKRDKTLAHRGLDFEDTPKVFAGRVFNLEDEREDYGEVRVLTFGTLDERLVVVVWTPRGDARHIISMRKCNEREKRKFLERLG